MMKMAPYKHCRSGIPSIATMKIPIQMKLISRNFLIFMASCITATQGLDCNSNAVMRCLEHSATWSRMLARIGLSVVSATDSVKESILMCALQPILLEVPLPR